MPIMFHANNFQPQIQPQRPKQPDGNETIDNKCTTQEAQPLPPEMATQKLEQEIAQAEQQLKTKLDHYVKILEQLGEPTFTKIGSSSGNSAQITQGNPHVDGFTQLLNAPMPQKGSISAEEGVKVLQDRLAQLNQALKDIDNDIREATLRFFQQQNDAANNATASSTVQGGGMETSQARFTHLGRSL